jgi:hypothetical protein
MAFCSSRGDIFQLEKVIWQMIGKRIAHEEEKNRNDCLRLQDFSYLCICYCYLMI